MGWRPTAAPSVNSTAHDRGGPQQPLLIAERLKKYFPVRGGILRRTIGHVQAVDGVSFRVRPGGRDGSGRRHLWHAAASVYARPPCLAPVDGPRGAHRRATLERGSTQSDCATVRLSLPYPLSPCSRYLCPCHAAAIVAPHQRHARCGLPPVRCCLRASAGHQVWPGSSHGHIAFPSHPEDGGPARSSHDR